MHGGRSSAERAGEAEEFAKHASTPMLGLDGGGVVRWTNRAARELFDCPVRDIPVVDLIDFPATTSSPWEAAGPVRVSGSHTSSTEFRWCPTHDAASGNWLARLQEPRDIEVNSQRLRELYEHTPAMLHSLGADRRFHVVSDHWLAKMHFERGAVEGRSAFELLSPDFRERARAIMGRMFNGQPINGETVWLRDGQGQDRAFRVWITSVLDADGHFVQSQTYLASLDEELELGEAIAQETLKAQRVLESIPWPVALVEGPTLRLVRTNDAFVSLFGERSELTECLVPEGLEAIRLWRQRFAGTAIPLALEVECAGGARRVLTMTIRPLPGDDRWALSFRESGDADAQRAELHASIAALEQFTYIASHDLRAPVRAVRQLLEFFEEDLIEARGPLPPEVAREVDALRSRVTRLGTLLDGLLTYSRAARFSPDGPSAFSLGEALPVLWAELRSKHRVDSISLELSESPPGAPLRLRPKPFLECLRHILENALQHADARSRVVRVQANVRGDTLIVLVEDDGPGIPAGEEERVFGLFQTIAPPRDDVAGVGLSVARRIARSLGAQVTLERGEGRGLRVQITWPLLARTP